MDEITEISGKKRATSRSEPGTENKRSGARPISKPGFTGRRFGTSSLGKKSKCKSTSHASWGACPQLWLFEIIWGNRRGIDGGGGRHMSVS